MNQRPRTVSILALLLCTTPAVAGITFYADRSAFNTAAPGLPLDHFGTTLSYSPYPNDYFFHARPVNSATNDSIFPSGSILPGLTIDVAHPLFPSQALKVEPIAGGNQVGTGTFQDTLILEFSPAVSAVGFDLLGHVYSHPLYDGNVEVTVYNGTTQLAYTNPHISGGSGFVGVTSTSSNITKITLLFNPTNDSSDTNTFVANLALPSSCPTDFDHSGFVDTDDFDAFVIAFEAGDPRTDFDASGFVDTDDFDAFVRAFESGC